MTPAFHLLVVSALGLTLAHAAPPASIDTLAEASKTHGVRLTIPEFPANAEAIAREVDTLIKHFSEAGDAIAAAKDDRTYESTIGALDGLSAKAGEILAPINILENTSPDAALRTAASEQLQRFEEWEVTFSYREDIYQSVSAFAEINPALSGEQARLLEETVRSYTRKGFGLPKGKRARIEAMQKRLAATATEFATNIREIPAPVTFSAKELEGVPQPLLDAPGVKTGEDEYTLQANITYHFVQVLDNAISSDTRRKMLTTRLSHVSQENTPLLERALDLRTRIAGLLGYATWVDYRTETRMAGNSATVRDFLRDLRLDLDPKIKGELATLAGLKAAETGDKDAKIESWDVRYYQNQLKKQRFAIDTEALRVFFPYEKTLAGMFGVYSTIFGITIVEVQNPAPWYEGVTLHSITDTATGKPLGLFYLDMFPREGKFNHFAQFGIIPARRESADLYQRPTVALICNFPSPEGDAPSLLTLDHVETLFHEFGHVLHSILTEADSVSFSGTNVPRDFVEAPSQVLEYWMTQKSVLDTFAADYRDPSKKLPQETLDNILAAELATIGLHYARQLSYALTDFNLHSYSSAEQIITPTTVANNTVRNIYLENPEDTTFVTSFGHIMGGYDSGYYGYAWADVISADLASIFEKSGNFLNPELGMKLRKEIFSQGHSRPIEESIEAFLGRPRSNEAFIQKLGIK